ncbi:uncharacterized protein PG998_012378 [Apiospora kogelbergensis]|uniref:Uncharacterized protein n=1 Tax=Apiospora kogelbergensis TaxID=1337665 RepID=A0AAW0QT68_9PEZI
MSSLAETSKTIRGRARDMSIKTGNPNSGSLHSSESDDTFPTGSFVYIPKPSSATAEPGSKKIEALLSTDWRNNRRPRADTSIDPPKTAIPAKIMSSPKPVLRVDTSRVTCDRIRDTPVAAEFIHSAPATKKEFADADDAENENHGTSGIELQANFGNSFTVHADLSDLISLDTITEGQSDHFDGSGSISSRFIKVTPADCTPSSSMSFEFPQVLAEMEKVDDGRTFLTQS